MKNAESELWNVHNFFIHCVNQKNAAGILKTISPEDIQIEFPDQQIQLQGLSEVIRYFDKWAGDFSSYTIHLVNSPFIEINETCGATSCMTASFEWNSAQESPMVTHFASRLDVSYVYRKEKWKISKIRWYDYAALTPWPVPAQDVIPVQDRIQAARQEPLPEIGPAEGDTYTGVANCVGKQMHRSVSQNQDFAMLFTPVITGNHSCAEGYWNGICFSRKDGESLAPSIIVMHGRFENREGQWCCIDSNMSHLFALPEMPPTPFAPPPARHMAAENRRSPLPEEQPGAPDPDDYFSIMNTGALWTSAIRTCCPTRFFKECLAKDHPDLYVNVTKRTEGLEGFFNECGMMVRMDQTQTKKPGNHTLTTPWIEISADGQSAAAAFLDFGWTMMAEAFGNTKAPYPVLPNIGRYIHHLVKENGKWKVWGFNWGPLYQNGAWSYDPQTSRGWSKTASKYRWPEVLEKYYYQEEFDGVNEFAANSILPYMKQCDMSEERREHEGTI